MRTRKYISKILNVDAMALTPDSLATVQIISKLCHHTVPCKLVVICKSICLSSTSFVVMASILHVFGQTNGALREYLTRDRKSTHIVMISKSLIVVPAPCICFIRAGMLPIEMTRHVMD